MRALDWTYALVSVEIALPNIEGQDSRLRQVWRRLLAQLDGGLLYKLLVVAIVCVGAWRRWRVTPMLMFDGDAMGYAAAALSWHSGGDFELVYARPFLYPLTLCAWLALSGSYVGIFYGQTCAGLLTMWIVERAWRRSGALFGFGRGGRVAYGLVGLAVVMAVGWSGLAIHYEMSIRPEAIFPLFAATSIYLSVRTFEQLREGLHTRLGFFWPAALLFVNLTMQVLKPNWGLGAVTASLPVAVWFCAGRNGWKARITTVVVSAGVFFAAVALPNAQLRKADPTAPLFGWNTLFLWHMPAIDRVMASDLASGKAEHAALLRWIRERANTEYEYSRANPDAVYYPILGYNPDRLLYGPDPIPARLAAAFEGDVDAQVVFMRDYYIRAWREQPRIMAAKVWSQLGRFYGRPEEIYACYGQEWRVRDELRQSVPILESYEPGDSGVTQRASATAVYRDFLRDCRAEAETNRDIVRTPRGLVMLLTPLFGLYLPCLIACLVACLAYWLLRRRLGVSSLGLPLLLAVSLFAHNFGNTLTFAIVHSMEIGRYSHAQQLQTIVSQSFGSVLLIHVVLTVLRAFGRRDRTRSAKPLLPPRAARSRGRSYS